MRVLGKERSKWWLLMIPLLLILSPFALFSLIVVGHLGGAIIGPTGLLSTPWHKPLREELVGAYTEPGHRTLNQIQFPSATLNLASDGSMSVDGLPDDPFEWSQTSCYLSGKGTWSGPHDDYQITLNYISNGTKSSCATSSYSLLQVTGHSEPYRLFWVIGDPDSGTGVWLKKEK